MTGTSCPTRDELDAILFEVVPVCNSQIEQHFEQCESCRHKIESMAGDQQWWNEVSATLGDSASREIEATVSSLLAARTPTAISTEPALVVLEDSRQMATRHFGSPVHPEMLGRIGRFDVESLIGRGGFGTVWKAWDTELNRPVAIKMLAEHLASNGTARRRFVREAQSAAAVTHPNVVPIHAVNGDAGLPWLVMAYVAGDSLEDLVRRTGPLPSLQIVRLAVQVAGGLEAAHQQGLVHRDIKPANILVETGSKRALITDFGLARAADDASITQTGWLAGTPHYMSPEQARGADIDARSDLFSLGSVMYYVATGRQAFRGDGSLAVLLQIGTTSPLPPRSVNADVPQFLSCLIMRLLEKDPRDRFSSAGELYEVLQRYLAHLQNPQSRPRPRMDLGRRGRRRLGVALAGAAIVVLSGASWWFWPELSRSAPPNSSATVANDAGQEDTLQLSRSWARFNSDIVEFESDLRHLESLHSSMQPPDRPEDYFNFPNTNPRSR